VKNRMRFSKILEPRFHWLQIFFLCFCAKEKARTKFNKETGIVRIQNLRRQSFLKIEHTSQHTSSPFKWVHTKKRFLRIEEGRRSISLKFQNTVYVWSPSSDLFILPSTWYSVGREKNVHEFWSGKTLRRVHLGILTFPVQVTHFFWCHVKRNIRWCIDKIK
jgi:hypothetical protein